MPVYPYKTRRDKMQSHEQWKSFGKSQEKNIFFFGNGGPCASMWNKIFPFSVFTVSYTYKPG